MSECAVEGCDRPSLTRGYCSRHYRRLLVYGDARALGARDQPKAVCSVEECTRFSRALGFCDYHYRKNKRFGDPLAEGPGRGAPGQPRRKREKDAK